MMLSFRQLIWSESHHKIRKKTHHGTPSELNYAAMIISLFIRYLERIPTIKNLVKRLRDDITFKINSGFLVSDKIPSEFPYSQFLTKLSKPIVLEETQETLVL